MTMYLSINSRKSLYLCGTHNSKTVSPINFKFGIYLRDGIGECGAKFGVVWNKTTEVIGNTRKCRYYTQNANREGSHCTAL